MHYPENPPNPLEKHAPTPISRRKRWGYALGICATIYIATLSVAIVCAELDSVLAENGFFSLNDPLFFPFLGIGLWAWASPWLLYQISVHAYGELFNSSIFYTVVGSMWIAYITFIYTGLTQAFHLIRLRKQAIVGVIIIAAVVYIFFCVMGWLVFSKLVADALEFGTMKN